MNKYKIIINKNARSVYTHADYLESNYLICTKIDTKEEHVWLERNDDKNTVPLRVCFCDIEGILLKENENDCKND